MALAAATPVSDDEDEPRQLTLTVRLDPGAAPSRLKDGNKWYESVEGLAKFRQFVAESRAVLAVGQQSPSSVALKFGRT